jgi:hypothetical protein
VDTDGVVLECVEDVIARMANNSWVDGWVSGVLRVRDFLFQRTRDLVTVALTSKTPDQIP